MNLEEYLEEAKGDGSATRQQKTGSDVYYKREHGDLKKGDFVHHDSTPETKLKIKNGFRLGASNKWVAHVVNTKTKEENHYPVSRLVKHTT